MDGCMRYCVLSRCTGYPHRSRRLNMDWLYPCSVATAESTVAGSCLGSPTKNTCFAP